MRYITPYILDDLKKKMVFVGGPRQVGKTTLARSLVAETKVPVSYFDLENPEDLSIVVNIYTGYS